MSRDDPSPDRDMIQRLSLKPVRSVELGGWPLSLRVVFEDGTVREKPFDIKLRLSLALLQHLRVRPLAEDASSRCIAQPLHDVFELLGYVAGDRIEFYDVERIRRHGESTELPIVFS